MNDSYHMENKYWYLVWTDIPLSTRWNFFSALQYEWRSCPASTGGLPALLCIGQFCSSLTSFKSIRKPQTDSPCSYFWHLQVNYCLSEIFKVADHWFTGLVNKCQIKCGNKQNYRLLQTSPLPVIDIFVQLPNCNNWTYFLLRRGLWVRMARKACWLAFCKIRWDVL